MVAGNDSGSGTGEDRGMSRRAFLKAGAMGAAAAAVNPLGLGQATAAAAGGKKPNIVYIFSDEHRWCSLPFTEMPQLKTPNMQRLANEGMRFENCCSGSPICVPYRGMLITGQWPHQSTCFSNDYFENADVVGKDSPTIAHVFKEAGYKTGYVGKWHLKNYSVYNASFDYFKHWLFGDEHWKTEVRDVPSREKFKTVEGYNAIGMTDQAIEFIESVEDGEDPFMLMVSINPPHWRWDDAPEEFVKMYPQDEIYYRPNVESRYKSGREALYHQHYHAHISAIDVQIGRMMDTLKEKGLDKDTIFIYSSDHGSSFGSNGVGSKGNPYEEAIRVPFIVSWPGRIESGKAVDNNLGTIDLFPTLCGLAGIKVPDFCGGQDFSQVMLGGNGPDPASQFILVNNFKRNYYRSRLEPGGDNIFYPFRGVRTKQFTYTVNADGEWMLYDNKNDRFQMRNLVNDPAYADVKAECKRELDKWLAKAEDPYIPQQWRKLSVPERVAVQNEYFTVMADKRHWDKYKADAVKEYASDGITQLQKDKLKAAADKIFDVSFFGMYLSLNNEINGRRRWSKRPIEGIKQEFAQLKKTGAEAFNAEAERILAK